MSVSRETCRHCDGAGQQFAAVGFDERDGVVLYERWPCTHCAGSGLVDDDQVPLWIKIATAVLLVAILAAAAALVWRRDLGLG